MKGSLIRRGPYFAHRDFQCLLAFVRRVFFRVHRVGRGSFERGGGGLRRSVVGFVEFDADDLAHAVLIAALIFTVWL